ncbi:Hypothetical protein NocV09_03400220 [Nannochloropsis oceanica]
MGFSCGLPLLLSLILALACPTVSLILSPVNAATGPDVALIILHGANVAPEAYVPLCHILQAKLQADVRLWVGLPDVDLNVPIYLDNAMQSLQVNLTARGMPANVPKILAGHSLGGIRSQYYANDHAEDFIGQTLMASALLREFDNVTYLVPTLTIGGEKDGNMRVSRLAQSSHIYRMQSDKVDDFPVVVVPGANHMSYCVGKPPLPVAAVDLTAEISKEEGHQTIAQVMAAFIRMRLRATNKLLPAANDNGNCHSSTSSRCSSTTSSSTDEEIMQAALEATAKVVDPLVKAMLLEGSWHFQPPCNSDRPSPHCPFYPVWPPQPWDREPSNETNCVCGCEWVEQVAQAHIGGLEEYDVTYVVRDSFHDVRDTEPYHHAHLWNECTDATLQNGDCILNITTVSELVFSPLDAFDAGFPPVTASEIRAKMKSRQAIYQQTIDPTAKLADTDNPDFCKEINVRAFAWAYAQAPPRTRERFRAVGVQPVFDADIRHRVQIGPLWINSPLRLQERYDKGSGKYVWHVRAPALVTDVSAHIYPDSAGYHYCKLLSPARALEWMYVDGLRRYDRQSGALEEEEGKEENQVEEEEEGAAVSVDEMVHWRDREAATTRQASLRAME